MLGRSRHACERCGGLWIEWSTLDRLERAFQSVKPKAASSAERLPPIENPVEETPLYKRCPECRQQMPRHCCQHVSRVVVDKCFGHGVWLGRSEFEHVLAFLEAGGLARSREYLSEREREDREAANRVAKLLRDEGPPPV